MIAPSRPAPLDALREGLSAAARRATAAMSARHAPAGEPLLISVGVALPFCEPLDLFARARALGLDALCWERPADGVSMAGLGAAWAAPAGGAAGVPLAAAGRAWEELLRDAVIDAPVVPWADGSMADEPVAALAGPLLMGGCAFDPRRPATDWWDGYGASRLVVPAVTLVAAGDASILTVNTLCRPAANGAAALSWPGVGNQLGDLVALCRREEGCDLRGHGAAFTRALAGLPPHADRGLDERTAVPTPAHPARGGPVVEEVCPRAEWEALVAAAAATCRSGELEKVVLARAVRARASTARAATDAPLDAVAALRYLRDAYPSAYIFAVAQGRRTFLGATPERLVRLRDGTVDVACLAGSAPRGDTPARDRQLGDGLLGSAKDRAEHAVVVVAVREALRDLCLDLSAPAVPRLLRLHNVQHLYTPVSGRPAPGVGVLDLVGRLHPTPAVGGYPREAALRFIRTHEGLDRGWYAGPVGWLDRHGNGEFAVALRSALLDGSVATLFAGCGIVGDSDPAAEYAETLLKLRPMLAALGRSL